MKKEIITENGVYSFKEVQLFLGRKVLNPQISKKNLHDFNRVMEVNGLKYGLWFGTLLGAIREGGFISYDEDIDIYMLNEDRKKFLNALFDFKKHGFKVARYRQKTGLLSLIRNDDYIDIYFYRKSLNKRIMGNNSIDAKYLENTENIDFLGMQIPVPVNSIQVLKIMYGEDWHIPNKDGKPINKSFKRVTKDFLIDKLPFIHRLFNTALSRK